MRAIPALPSLADAIRGWRQRGEFLFLSRFLDGMPKVQPAQGAMTRGSAAWSRGGARLRQVSDGVRAAFGVLAQLASCVAAPRGSIAVFNHSVRVRRTASGLRPLYLSGALPLARMTIFEDESLPLIYEAKVRRGDARAVNRFAGLLTRVYFACRLQRPTVEQHFIASFYMRRALWRLVLRLLQPSCVRLYVWYGKDAVVAAARSLRIEVADVQHGIIYPSHPFYDHRNVVPEVCDVLMPDRYLVYGEYWRTLLIRSGIDAARIDVLGYALDLSPGQPASGEGRRYVLYTSQPHTNELVAAHIRSILGAVIERGWKVVIARHPSEGNDVYRELLGPAIELSALDSYDLLRECEVHVSASSTLLWEAMIFGKSSYMLTGCADAPELLQDLITFGFGRWLGPAEFPEPFALPTEPGPDFFFQRSVNATAFSAPRSN